MAALECVCLLEMRSELKFYQSCVSRICGIRILEYQNWMKVMAFNHPIATRQQPTVTVHPMVWLSIITFIEPRV